MKKTSQRNSLYMRWAVGLAPIVVLLAIWFVMAQKSDSVFLPNPIEVLTAMIDFLKTPIHLGTSLLRVFLGFFIGTVAGLGIGLLLSESKAANMILGPLVNLLRPIPVLALIPIFILWFGIGYIPQILLISFGCFVIMIVTTSEAVSNVPPIYRQAAATLGCPKNKVFFSVVFPYIIPSIMGGLRASLAATWGLDVAAEFIGAQSGIGYQMIVFERYMQINGVVALVVIVTIVAYLTDWIMKQTEKQFTEWSGRHVA